MKRPFRIAISVSSLAVIALCSIALANSEDHSNDNAGVDAGNNQQAGQVADPNSADQNSASSDHSQTTQSTTTTTTKSDANLAKSNTCVDENGVILHRSDKAFKACQDVKRQQSGQSGQMDQNNKSNSNSKDSSLDTSSVPPSDSHS